MIVPFSRQIPDGALTIDEYFSPFKTFVVEFSKNIIESEFTSEPKLPIPECFICGMSFNSGCRIKKSELRWVCVFCGKENMHEKVEKLHQSNQSRFLQAMDLDDRQCETETDELMDSTFAGLRNLVILIVDFSLFMEDVQMLESGKDSFSFKDAIQKIITRDITKDYPSSSRFLLILCNSEVLILTNDSKNKTPIKMLYEEYKSVSGCFKKGQEIARTLDVDNMNNAKYIQRELEKQDFHSLSSIGAGFAVAMGITQVLNPKNPKIVLIGEGSSCFGACRTLDFEDPRQKESIKELENLYKRMRNPYQLNIQAFNLGEEEDSFFDNLEKVFTTTVCRRKNLKLKMINLKPEDPIQNVYGVLKVAASPNVLLIPYENLVVDKNSYSFEENHKVFKMTNLNRERRLYPFHFEFTAGKQISDNEQIVFQTQLKIHQAGLITTYVTTETLEVVREKHLSFPLLNFSVVNYCYYASDLFENKAKREGLMKLIQKYIENKGKLQIPLLKSLRFYIEDNYKVSFDIGIKDSKELSLKIYLPNKKDCKINFNIIERVSEYK